MLQGFSVKDEKAAIFMAPFFVKNIVVAVRSVSQAAIELTSQLNKYPDDFALYKMCDFNEETGETIINTPTIIITISELLKKGANHEVN